MSTLETQVGGDHYRQYDPQPAVWLHKNRVPWIEANVVKYTLRHRSKGRRQDLEKAIHYLRMLIELEYPEPVSGPGVIEEEE